MRALIILLFMVSCSISYSQCKGFEKKQDEFKGELEIGTLWITNSTKIFGNKLQYRVFLHGDTTLLAIKVISGQKIKVQQENELIFLNDNGDTFSLKPYEEYESVEINTTAGKGQEIKAKFIIPDPILKEWNTSFKKCRMYYSEDSMTFEFNHKKNLKLFHNAFNCYKEEYFEM